MPRLLVLLVALCRLVPAAAPAAVPPPADGQLLTAQQERQIAPGLRLATFDTYDARGWLRAHLLTADLRGDGSRPTLLGTTVTGLAPVSTHAGAAGAVAGVNGDFFNINETGAAIGPEVRASVTWSGSGGVLVARDAAGVREAARADGTIAVLNLTTMQLEGVRSGRGRLSVASGDQEVGSTSRSPVARTPPGPSGAGCAPVALPSRSPRSRPTPPRSSARSRSELLILAVVNGWGVEGPGTRSVWRHRRTSTAALRGREPGCRLRHPAECRERLVMRDIHDTRRVVPFALAASRTAAGRAVPRRRRRRAPRSPAAGGSGASAGRSR